MVHETGKATDRLLRSMAVTDRFLRSMAAGRSPLARTHVHDSDPRPAVAAAFLHSAGMVRETGEATERFLRSMAAGDASAKRELEEAAAAALANVTSPCNAADPSSMAALAGNLVQGAHGLNRQLQGLLTALRSAAGMRPYCVPCCAVIGVIWWACCQSGAVGVA
jgi:hypothetical protein